MAASREKPNAFTSLTPHFQKNLKKPTGLRMFSQKVMNKFVPSTKSPMLYSKGKGQFKMEFKEYGAVTNEVKTQLIKAYNARKGTD